MVRQAPARTPVIATLSLIMGFIAHWLQGGSVPAAGDVLAAVVLAVVLVAVLVRRALTVRALAVRLVAVQLAIHLMCQMMPAAHGVHQMRYTSSNNPVVLAIHVSAVVLVATWLVAVEGHLRRLVEVLWRVWGVACLPTPAVTADPESPVLQRQSRNLNLLLLDAHLARRGPPLAV